MNTLIVDDIVTNGLVFKGLVKRTVGGIPDVSQSPRQALEWCAQRRYDLIVVDHYMPELTGAEFAKQVRGLDGYADTPIFMITSAQDAVVCTEAFKSGVTDFLSKPVKLYEFKNLLCRHLKTDSNRQVVWIED